MQPRCSPSPPTGVPKRILGHSSKHSAPAEGSGATPGSAASSSLPLTLQLSFVLRHRSRGPPG